MFVFSFWFLLPLFFSLPHHTFISLRQCLDTSKYINTHKTLSYLHLYPFIFYCISFSIRWIPSVTVFTSWQLSSFCRLFVFRFGLVIFVQRECNTWSNQQSCNVQFKNIVTVSIAQRRRRRKKEKTFTDTHASYDDFAYHFPWQSLFFPNRKNHVQVYTYIYPDW